MAKREKKDLSFTHKTTGDMGKLIPIGWFETLPNENHEIDVSAFIRGMPTIAPIMDQVDIKINHFYVPNRILWDYWTKFISQNDYLEPQQFPQLQIESIDKDAWNATSEQDKENLRKKYQLADYLGLNMLGTKQSTDMYISALPFLAYQKIFIDNYAPQRWINFLQKNGQVHPLSRLYHTLEKAKKDGFQGHLTTDGREPSSITQLQNVYWNHDYIANALPTPNMFGEVSIPLVDNAYLDKPEGYLHGDVNGVNSFLYASKNHNQKYGAKISDLRENIALQHYLEKLNIGGGRYYETIKMLWDYDLDDRTLQMSQYLGGDVMPLFFNEIESTAETDGRALGELAGKPLGAGNTGNIKFESPEHGIYMCIAHVVPKRSYMSPISKTWFRTEPLDYPVPEFEGIGDQPIYQFEVTGVDDTFQDGNSPFDKIFGYVPRYSEYDGKLDVYSGEFKSTLQDWHLGSTPDEVNQPLSPEFLLCNPRNDIFQVKEPNSLLMTWKFKIDSYRTINGQYFPGLSRI